MNAHRQKGFTAVELVAVLAVLLILAGIVATVFVSGRSTAVTLRRIDAAAILNSAEQALTDHNSTTADALGQEPVIAPSDPAGRIGALKNAGFLGSLVNTSDVVLTSSNGVFLWIPAPP